MRAPKPYTTHPTPDTLNFFFAPFPSIRAHPCVESGLFPAHKSKERERDIDRDREIGGKRERETETERLREGERERYRETKLALLVQSSSKYKTRPKSNGFVAHTQHVKWKIIGQSE